MQVKVTLHQDKVVKEKKDRDGDKVGTSTGLKITHFCNNMFQQNFKEEKNDEDLEATLKKEFANRKTLQSIAAYRGYFNAAKHGFGTGEPLEKENRLKKVRPVKAGEKKTTVTKKDDKAKKAPAKAKKQTATK